MAAMGVEAEIEAVFAEFQEASDSEEWHRFERLFLPTFLSLDPASAAPVERDALIAFLPHRRGLFARAGATGTRMTGLEVVPLDGMPRPGAHHVGRAVRRPARSGHVAVVVPAASHRGRLADRGVPQPRVAAGAPRRQRTRHSVLERRSVLDPALPGVRREDQDSCGGPEDQGTDDGLQGARAGLAGLRRAEPECIRRDGTGRQRHPVTAAPTSTARPPHDEGDRDATGGDERRHLSPHRTRPGQGEVGAQPVAAGHRERCQGDPERRRGVALHRGKQRLADEQAGRDQGDDRTPDTANCRDDPTKSSSSACAHPAAHSRARTRPPSRRTRSGPATARWARGRTPPRARWARRCSRRCAARGSTAPGFR